MYPDEFEECDGTKELTPGVTIGQQERKTFGLAYKTLLGNDTDGDAHGYKIHIIYGALASPSEKSHETHSLGKSTPLLWKLQEQNRPLHWKLILQNQILQNLQHSKRFCSVQTRESQPQLDFHSRMKSKPL